MEDTTQKSFNDVKSEIDNAADFIDAVVISGGEPLMQLDALIDLFAYIKSINLKTKLDTSGIYPEKVEKLLELELLDFVSLDIKAPFEKYRKITGANVGSQVKKSMKLLNDSNVCLELRTTYVPTLHTKKDIKNLVSDVEGDIYTIQQFRNKNVWDPDLEKVDVPNPHDLVKLAQDIKPLFDGIVKVKTGEFGEQIIG